MPYRFAVDRPDYSDFASGRVFHSLPGHPAFPIRLASEIFQRCLAHRRAAGGAGPVALYDPCCGAGYLLSVLACLHGESIRAIAASDADPKAADLAARNLELLTMEGFERRIEALAADYSRYRKESHRQALESARRMRGRIAHLPAIQTRVFPADAGCAADLLRGLAGLQPDVAIADLPYGLHSRWEGSLGNDPSPAQSLLGALAEALPGSGVVAVVSGKSLKAAHEKYRRLEQFPIGKRRITILERIP